MKKKRALPAKGFDMSHKRRTRHKAGIINALGRASTREGRQPPSAHIVDHLTRLRHRLAKLIAPDITWNSDISLENDRLRVEIERLQSLVDTSSDKGGAA